MSRIDYIDLAYSDSSRDWAMDGGDLAPFIRDYEDLLTQTLVNALECTFGAMDAVVERWGFEGRNYVYNNPNDDLPKVRVKLYLTDILERLPHLVRWRSHYTTWTFGTADNTFEVRVECVLANIQGTVYDHTFTWSGSTKRVTVT